MNYCEKQESGQIVLITLLVLAIATTVALSLISRTTNDASITRDVEESSRAFSAAEAGIEQALLSSQGTDGAVVLAPGVSYDVSVVTIGNAAGAYVLPKKTLAGVTETVWLVNHDSGGSLTISPTYTAGTISICWKNEGGTIPAILATILYQQTGVIKVARAAIDPDTTRAAQNNFDGTTDPLSNCVSEGMTYRKNISFSADFGINPAVDTVIALRLRPIYNNTHFAVRTGATVLPAQGYRIESTGTTVGGTNRKIVVYQQYRSPSTIFDAALYSEGVLRK